MVFGLIRAVKGSANILAKAHINELEKRLSTFVEEGKEHIKKVTKHLCPDFETNKREYVNSFVVGTINIDKEFEGQAYLKYLSLEEIDEYRLTLNKIIDSKIEELKSYKIE